MQLEKALGAFFAFMLALGISSASMGFATWSWVGNVLPSAVHPKDGIFTVRSLSWPQVGSQPTLADWRGLLEAHPDREASFFVVPFTLTLRLGAPHRGQTETLRAALTDGQAFEYLGVPLQLGVRYPERAELASGAPSRLVIISDGLWSRAFSRG